MSHCRLLNHGLGTPTIVGHFFARTPGFSMLLLIWWLLIWSRKSKHNKYPYIHVLVHLLVFQEEHSLVKK